ncbi:MAG: sugar ABC transporter substrate-binding protein [Syntrophomonadaceae bacterium]
MKKSKIVLTIMMILMLVVTSAGCQMFGSKKPVEPVTIYFSYPPYGYDTDKEMAFWNTQIAAFQAANPNIKVEFSVESWDNVYTKWEQALETGATPDIGYDCPITAVDYALQGKVLPVTDLVNKLGGDAAFNEGMLDYKAGGEWYGVPHGDASMVLLYRKDLLKAAGYDNPPKNWDELVEIAKATTKNGVYGFGFFTGDDYQSSQILTGLMAAAGGVMIDKDGKVALNSPENLKALELVDLLYNKLKVVPESTLTWEHSDPANAIGTGKVAMAVTWGGYGTLLPSMFPDQIQNIGFAKLPDGPSGHSGSWSGTGGFFIFKNAKHPEEAKQFIEYMSKPELSKEWALISGNVSPFVSITNDPELTKLEWYKAMQDQSPTQITLGWGHDIILGAYMCDPIFTEAMVNVTINKKPPQEALKILQENVEKTIQEANAKK